MQLHFSNISILELIFSDSVLFDSHAADEQQCSYYPVSDFHAQTSHRTYTKNLKHQLHFSDD